MGYAYSAGAIIVNPIGLVSSANSPDVQPSLPFPNTLGVLSSLTFVSGGGNPTGISSVGHYSEHNVNHNGFGSLTKIKGQHTLKFGLSYDHYQKRETNGGVNNQGSFGFTNGPLPSASTLAGLGDRKSVV